MGAKRPTAARVRKYKALQNEVRRAINFFPAGEKDWREGVEPSHLKRHIRLVLGDAEASRISLRLHGDGDAPEYALRYDGELLFRIVWVDWPQTFGGGHHGRWHVRRHPAAVWWRSDNPKVQPRRHRQKRR